MGRPTITIEGKTYEMKKLTGRDWRIIGEFINNAPKSIDADFVEKHADFIAKFFGVTADDILDKMQLEDIIPASIETRDYLLTRLSAKIKVIEKNADAGDKTE